MRTILFLHMNGNKNGKKNEMQQIITLIAVYSYMH